MRTITRLATICGVALVLGACSQQEEPPAPIYLTPTIDKLGNASCPAGTVLAVDGATGNQVCAEAGTI